MSGRRPSICFVAQNAFGALQDRPTGHSGGIERQESLQARWFAGRGYRVSLVTWDEGQAEDVVVAGVRVVKLCGPRDGLPGLRFVHPRWTSLWRALRRADADIYHYASGDLGLGQIVLWCRRQGRRLVYSVSATGAADPALPDLGPRRERILYRYGLRHADRVIVQTRRQQRMLREGFALDSVLIPMPSEGLPGANGSPRGEPIGQPRVLWVGRFSAEKRLEWLLDAAQRYPEAAFDVVGAPNLPSAYADRLARRAEGIPNVVLHGRIADGSKLAALYRAAAVLCCTSVLEGFPNTFLEAWSCGLPVVSTYDPDDLIASRNLGAVAGTVDEVVTAIRELLRSPERYGQASANARRHYLDNHAREVVMPRIEGVLLDLFDQGDLAHAGPGIDQRGSSP
jgi:glycosyltransferase involved in cell wall biosynthesis